MRYSNQILTMRDGEVKVKQVTKRTAKKVYDEGKTVYLQSCNMRFNNFWQSPCPVNKTKDVYERTFDQTVLEFENYNCDNERGKYAQFFIEI